MGFSLGPKALAAGYRLAAYETIGSTSSEAMERARAGDPGRLWVAASAQTEGRGRRGRSWETASGNLAASLLLVLPPDAAAPTLGFAAGLALEKAIRVAAGDRIGPELRLKWPNDVLLGDGKVAGILLEAASLDARSIAVVIGIGINVCRAPSGLPYPAKSLASVVPDIGADDLFGALSDAWVDQERIWNAGRGFGSIRDRWIERAAGLGSPIEVSVGADTIRGTFETIDDGGRLVVRAADGSAQTIAAGDVHFGAAATVR
jgi:BirA family biotin operon repressor/biotin-[acetyl-CoA-carboxylase] ligase